MDINWLMVSSWVFIGILALNAIVVVLQVGKPRLPITGGAALVTLVVNAILAWIMLTWMGVL